MNEKELKTSPKQRFFIIMIAVLMLGSMIASYALIVANGGKTQVSDGSNVDQAKIAELEAKYDELEAKFKIETKADFDEFSSYRSEIKGFNETTANDGEIQTRDLKKGSGRKLAEGETNYYAYYVGWCPDESIFDSSFDDNNNPTALSKALDASLGMIEGWNAGVVGMRMDGIREITIPGELAYGDSMEICGGYNKPLKFLVMVKEKEDPLKSMAEEMEEASMRLQYAYYGMDYDSVIQEQ